MGEPQLLQIGAEVTHPGSPGHESSRIRKNSDARRSFHPKSHDSGFNGIVMPQQQPSPEETRLTLAALKQRVAELETRLSSQDIPGDWQPARFYFAFYATVGFGLGGIAAMTSLLLNVIGSSVAGKHPLEIIRVYLTFPLGEQALRLTSAEGTGYVIDDGMILALGCCLYIATGMVLGTVFHSVICRFAEHRALGARLLVASALSAAVWIINYYLILSWLQPALFGGNWITDDSVLPWWVALTTHLIFGWSMAVLTPLGSYVAYHRPLRDPEL